MKYKVASCQFGYRFGDQLHMPYAIGILVSYLNRSEEIRNNFEFFPTAVDRPKVYEYAEKYSQADILLCSCYSWNWEITKILAQEIKIINPKCLVILGGPQIPGKCEELLDSNKYMDLIVHNEGEVILKNIFTAYLNNKSFDGIKGLSTRTATSWFPEDLVKNLDEIPSPYLDGTMHKLIDPKAASWIATWETMRGCPYECSYCAWGKSANNTVRKFEIDRLYKEVDWFSKNKIVYIDCSDANFGMFSRDVDIAKYIKKVKVATGYPITFKPSWDKKVTDKIVDIAEELKSVGLLTSIGCSLQSLDKNTLTAINRKSVTFEEFVVITDGFKRKGTQCFTEIIRALPGETLETFKEGLNKVIFESCVDTVYIYNCTVLENTDLNSEAFREKYKIDTVRVPLYFGHASINANDIVEYEDLIISSATFTRDDVEKMYLYSWYILTFQHLGIINYITRYIVKNTNTTYSDFFSKFEAYCECNQTSLFSKEYWYMKSYIKNGYDGKGWNHIDPELGPIVWPVDEASWLRVTKDNNRLRKEICIFISEQFGLNFDDEIRDLVEFQLFTLVNKNNLSKYIIGKFDIDWIEYFATGEISRKKCIYTYNNKITEYSDDFDWNTKAIWYGRRKVSYKARLEEIICTPPKEVMQSVEEQSHDRGCITY